MKRAALLIDEDGAGTERRTAVLSREAQFALKTLLLIACANAKKPDRDAVLVAAIIFFEYLMKDRDAERKLEMAQGIVDQYWSQGEAYEQELTELLGENHRIVARFRYLLILAMNLSMAIEAELKHGIPIDPDDFSQQG